MQPGFIERALTWALECWLHRKLSQRRLSREIIRRELSAVRDNLVAFNNHQMTETEIISDRLGRRYDPGMALNEATLRALADKETARQAEAPESKLTGNQIAALEIQKQYLKRIIRTS